MSADPDGRRDASRRPLEPRVRAAGLVLALGGLLMTVDTTVAVVAVPAVVEDLRTTLPGAQGMTTAYLLGVVAVIPLAGWLSRRLGARRVYISALALFALASAAAGLAPGMAVLVAARALQGLGGGLLNPVGQAIGLRLAPPSATGRLMAILGLPVAIGPVIGPPLAGWLIDVASWRWIFWVNIPVGLVAIALCLLVLPADSPLERRAREPFDAAGLALISTGAVLTVLGCTALGDSGRVSGSILGAVLGGPALLALGAVRALRARHPILDLRLLGRHRPLSTGGLVLVLFGAAYFGSMAIIPLYIQGVLGGSALRAGLVMMPQALAVGVSIQVATRLVDRVPAHRVVLAGTSLAAAGALGMLGAMTSHAGTGAIVGASILLGLGSGATIMPTMTTALRGLEGTDVPRATTLLALGQQLASALGVAVIATATTLLLRRLVPELGEGAVGAMLALDTAGRQALSPALADGIGLTFALVAALATLSTIIAGTRLRSATRSERSGSR